MKQILKRLELIKTAISIEDEEIVELQVMKLNSMACDEEVLEILVKLENKDYGNVVVEIEQYLQCYSGVVVYEDKELQGLRLELKALEKKFQDLNGKKNEYLNDIHEFNVQYHLHLGELIQKILHLKEELLYKSMQKKKNNFEDLKSEFEKIKAEKEELKSKKEDLENELGAMDEFDDGYDELYEKLQELKKDLDAKEAELNKKKKETKKAKKEFEEDEVTQEYEDLKQDSEEFTREYKEVQEEERLSITDKEKKELKKLFKKASKLCHPDIVSEELKKQAQVIFQKLNDANSKRDIKTVREILHSLESGNGFNVSSDTIDDKDLLKSKITDIRDMIFQDEVEIEIIKESEAIKIMQEYNDLEEYFSKVKSELEAEYDRLKNEAVMNDTSEEMQYTQANDNFSKVYNEDEYKSTSAIARENNLVIPFFIAYLEENGYLHRDIDNSLAIDKKAEALHAKYRYKDDAIWIVWPPNSLDDVVKQFKDISVANTAYDDKNDFDDDFWSSDY